MNDPQITLPGRMQTSEKLEDPKHDPLKALLNITGKASNARPCSTFRIPPSSALARVQQFLPKIAAANTMLNDKTHPDMNIENVEEGSAHIEMNLALVQKESSSDSESSECSDNDSDTNGDSDIEENMIPQIIDLTEDTLKLSPCVQNSNKIQVLNSSDSTETTQKCL